MRIKNWDKYQLYKHKSMPWFKVYGRDLLNDRDWHLLSTNEKSTLLELWCLASEDFGNLPEPETIAFRLRRTIEGLKPVLDSLLEKDWLCIEPVLEQYSECMLDKIRIDKDKIINNSSFDEFWKAYPRKVGKEAARKSWNKKQPDINIVLHALQWQKQTNQWFVDNGKFIPHPTTYINQERWLDEPNEEVSF